MGLFGKKKRDFVDLTKHYEKQKAQLKDIQSDMVEIPKESPTTENSNAGFVSLFGNANNSSPTKTSAQETPEGYSNTINPEEKRRRLTKRIKEMTDKLENLSNQLYHIGQRLEVVERKLEVGRF